MVSKRWQRTQTYIAHSALAVCGGLPFFLFETNLEGWVKLTGIVVGYVIFIPLFRWLHRRYATSFVKVFKCDYEIAGRIVQRTLNAERIPFTKRTEAEQIVFMTRPSQIQLTIDPFALNLMVDHYLTTEEATLLTLKNETPENKSQMKAIRTMLDDAFAVQGWGR